MYDNISERQAGINKAFGRMYFAIYSIDLADGKYLEISTLDIFREHIPVDGTYRLLFDMVVTHYVSDGYKEGMREFLDMDTLQERLSEQNAVSNEFFGTTQGWCRASLVVETRDGSGRVTRFLYVTQEINEEVKTEQERVAELKRAYGAVETANKAKSDFLFRMSHDIRTPLNAIMGFDHLIESSADDPQKVREYASKIKISGNLLLSLLNEILDMTKLESGVTVLDKERFTLSELTDELYMVISSQTSAKSQTFSLEKTDMAHDTFIGDKVRLSRILFNILSNAVKYTETGGTIVFGVGEEPTEAIGRTTLVFTVADNGIGMTHELMDKVFDEFIRGADKDVGDIPGAGLGLPIAKSFAQMMGGNITVRSEQGKGSEFTVRIPLATADDIPDKEPDNSPDDDADILHGTNILVVEDNELNMEITTAILTMAGATCDEAYSGAEALKRIEESAPGKYDIIIMDICMPEMDGYETTRRIRGMGRADMSVCPIVALTANAFEEDVVNARHAGMNAHMAKPFDIHRFKTMIASLSGQRRRAAN